MVINRSLDTLKNTLLALFWHQAQLLLRNNNPFDGARLGAAIKIKCDMITAEQGVTTMLYAAIATSHINRPICAKLPNAVCSNL